MLPWWSEFNPLKWAQGKRSMKHLTSHLRSHLRHSLPVMMLFSIILLGHSLVKADLPSVQAYYVRYEEGRKIESINQIGEIGGVVNHDLSRWNLLAVSIPSPNLQRLNSLSSVKSFEPVPAYELAGEEYTFGLDMVQALDVWDFDRDGLVDAGAPTGNGIKVCIIDTGVFDSHKDFAATTIDGFSQIDGEEWNETVTGHGSHVAGTLAANMQGSGLAGVAPGVELFIVKVYDNRGGWILGQSNVGAAAATCADNGADIINLSLKGDKSVEEEEIFQSLYKDEGILVVAAAANDGGSSGTEDDLAYPASYDSVISVASITSSYTHASYSNENDKVELTAPGSAVISTWPTPENGSIPSGKVVDNEMTHVGMYIENSTPGTQSSTLIDGGLCREEDKTGDWSGQIVLCQRQDLSFSAMVNNAEDEEAVATIIIWKEEGLMVGSLGSGTSSGPVVMVGKDAGDFLKDNKLGSAVTVETHDGSDYLEGPGGYRGLRGTSMASPHVAGAAALVWSACPDLSNQELRQLLTKTALDLGPADWDFSFGHGLVQAFDAWHHCQPADLGDLPRDYGQVRHTGDGALKLGILWESNSWQGEYPGVGHDDQNDDGISISPLIPGEEAMVYVRANGQAQTPWISGWLDYNRDGKFSSVEEIVNDAPDLNTVTEFTFTVPITLNMDMPIHYRFRLYDKGINNLNMRQGVTNLPATIAGGEAEDGVASNIPTAVSLSTIAASTPNEDLSLFHFFVLFLAIITIVSIALQRNTTLQT